MTLASSSGIFRRKLCKAIPWDEKGKEFCDYLSIHTSSEYLAPNISRAMACLNSWSYSPKKNVLTDELIGRFKVFEPYDDAKNIEIEFEYFFSRNAQKDEHFSITVQGVQSEE